MIQYTAGAHNEMSTISSQYTLVREGFLMGVSATWCLGSHVRDSMISLYFKKNRNDNWAFCRLLEQEACDGIRYMVFDIVKVDGFHT